MDAFSPPGAGWTLPRAGSDRLEDSPISIRQMGTTTLTISCWVCSPSKDGKPLERLYSKQIIKPLHLKYTPSPTPRILHSRDARAGSSPKPSPEPLNSTTGPFLVRPHEG